MKTPFKLLIALFVTAALFAFTRDKIKIPSENKKSEWISLFDGKTLNGWHGYNKTGPVKNWVIEDGAIMCIGSVKDIPHGDLTTDKIFANFELKWEWKVEKGSNSGVLYHVQEGPKWTSSSETGPEYQIIDDVTFPEHLEVWQQAGADYAMHPANDQKVLKPVGEWNTGEIIFNKGHVEHWLNGKKIVEFEAYSKDWKKKHDEGKWKDYPDYAKTKTGEIALQDHGDKAYYKNIMIKEL